MPFASVLHYWPGFSPSDASSKKSICRLLLLLLDKLACGPAEMCFMCGERLLHEKPSYGDDAVCALMWRDGSVSIQKRDVVRVVLTAIECRTTGALSALSSMYQASSIHWLSSREFKDCIFGDEAVARLSAVFVQFTSTNFSVFNYLAELFTARIFAELQKSTSRYDLRQDIALWPLHSESEKTNSKAGPISKYMVTK